MTSIHWTQPTKSGLCDRLMDLFLLAACAKLRNKNLTTDWPASPHSKNNPYVWHDGIETRQWNEVRYYDYLYENFSQYFNIPDNIIINKTPKPTEYFPHRLGGVYSPITFHAKFLHNMIPLKTYIDTFYDMTSQFTPTQKLIDLIKTKNIPTISTHLRRGDKIRGSGELNDDNFDQKLLDDLNHTTNQTIEKLIKGSTNVLKSNNFQKKLFFCSDNEACRKEYQNKYQRYDVIPSLEAPSIERTYYDMYMLINSEYIIMSQKYSSFAMFCSFVKKAKLIYLYNEGTMAISKFNELANVTYCNKL